MRKGQDIKLKPGGHVSGLWHYAGRTSCLGIALFAMCAINPLTAPLASASEEVAEAAEGGRSVQGTDSTVNIAFAPVVGTGSMTPVDSTGAKARFSVKVTVRVQNSGGYNIYFGSDSSNLTRSGGTETIAPISGSATYDNIETNTWGYTYTEADTIADTAMYQAVPSTLRGTPIYTNNNASIKDETKTYTIGFVAHVGSDKPAGTYQNHVTMSVVSSPLETLTGLASITKMQEMTSAICAASDPNETKQLIDTRDNKSYWVTKMADGHCWMTQNLDLDIPASGLLASNSDMTANWTKPTAATTSTISSSTVSKVTTDSRSWDQGLYVLNTPFTGVGCASSTSNPGLSASDCATTAGFVKITNQVASTDPDFFTKTSYTGTNGGLCTKAASTAISTATSGECAQYDAHYLVGNWYQWNAATAGSGVSLRSTSATEAGLQNAPSSICPKNWRLPTSGGTDVDKSFNQDFSFGKLWQVYGWNGTTTTAGSIQSNLLVTAPLYYMRSGYVFGTGYISGPGEYSLYWSSTAGTTTNDAYSTHVRTGVYAEPADVGPRYYGFSVRCVAR